MPAVYRKTQTGITEVKQRVTAKVARTVIYILPYLFARKLIPTFCQRDGIPVPLTSYIGSFLNRYSCFFFFLKKKRSLVIVFAFKPIFLCVLGPFKILTDIQTRRR